MTQPDSLAAVVAELRQYGKKWTNIHIIADRIERLDAEMRKDVRELFLEYDGVRAELAACRLMLADPRVRALFPPLPDGAVLGSCDGKVYGETAPPK